MFRWNQAPPRALAAREAPAPGEVWLIGAGPGDPELLTLRAATAIRGADLVLHDHIPARIARAHARPTATLGDVGKRKGAARVPQAKIIARMLDAARAGHRVVRLKAGETRSSSPVVPRKRPPCPPQASPGGWSRVLPPGWPHSPRPASP